MRTLVLFMVLVSILMVKGQNNEAYCTGKCNLMMCIQVNGVAANDKISRNVAENLIVHAYKANAPCPPNFGLAYYRDNINSPCPMFPAATKAEEETCLANAYAAQTVGPNAGNSLEVCLEKVNNDGDYWPIGYSLCRYSLVLIVDPTIKNPALTIAAATSLKNKGVRLYCYIVGAAAYDTVYDQICYKTNPVASYPELWLIVETIGPALDCCGDPTPTTHAPTTQPTPAPATDVCTGCKIVNGVGYISHPTRCDCWNRCLFHPGGAVYAIMNCCKCGLFWDQGLLTCVPANDETCAIDQCKTGVANYAYEGNCLMYWMCEGEKTAGTKCCEEGERYNATAQACENDPSGECKDLCDCGEQTSASENCTFTWNPSDLHSYYMREYAGAQLTLMACAPGTNFNRTTCKCSDFVVLPFVECPVDFHLKCAEFPLVDHANNAYIANYKVFVDVPNEQCILNGDARLMVPRFANYDWRYKFAVTVEFNGQGNLNSNNAPLISNTDCGEPSSLEIRLLRVGPLPFVEGYIVTADGTFVVRLPYKDNQVNTVYLSYDGDKLKMTVKYADLTKVTDSVAATGLMLRCKCALQYAYGWLNRYYQGRIHESKIYINCIPANFHP